MTTVPSVQPTEPLAWAAKAYELLCRAGDLLCEEVSDDEELSDEIQEFIKLAHPPVQPTEPVAQVHVDENGYITEDPWTDTDIDNLLEALEREPGDEQFAADAITVIKQLRAHPPVQPTEPVAWLVPVLNDKPRLFTSKQEAREFAGQSSLTYPQPLVVADGFPYGKHARPPAVTAEPVAMKHFEDWFAKNYPAPAIISDPHWHAPKIFRAAKYAIERAYPVQPTEPEVAAAIEWCDAGWRVERTLYEVTPDPMHDGRSKSFKNALDVIRKLAAQLEAADAELARLNAILDEIAP